MLFCKVEFIMDKNFTLLTETPLVENFYKYLEFDKKEGFLLQIGVGNLIDYPGRDELMSRGIRHQPVEYLKLASNTTELLELGWKGVCIDPVAERLIQCQILHKEKLQKLSLINHAASDRLDLTYSKFYNKHVKCYRTSDLMAHVCPKFMELLVVSVSGSEDKVLKGINFSAFDFKMLIINIEKFHHLEIKKILPSEYIELFRNDCSAIYLNNKL